MNISFASRAHRQPIAMHRITNAGFGRLLTRSIAPPRSSSTRAALPVDYARFLDQVAFLTPPPRFEALLRVLEAQGAKLIDPATHRRHVHPFLLPFAQMPDDRLVGLFRWPMPSEHPGMEVPVAASHLKHAHRVEFLSRSVDEYLGRALATEDASSSSSSPSSSSSSSSSSPSSHQPIAMAAGPECRDLYLAGDFARSKLGRLEVFLTRRIGMFPDTMESLALHHLQSKSENATTSALVTGEFYMKNNHFPGTARPYEFNAALMMQVGRREEARDVARVALRLPWWTLGGDVATCRSMAMLEDKKTALALMFSLSEEAMAASSAARQSRVPSDPKSPMQMAIEEANYLMNQVAAGETTWEEVNGALASSYERAGLNSVAALVRSAKP